MMGDQTLQKAKEMGAALHWRKGNFHPKAALLCATTGMIGAFGGSFLTHMVSQRVLVGIFAALMLETGGLFVAEKLPTDSLSKAFGWFIVVLALVIGGLAAAGVGTISLTS